MSLLERYRLWYEHEKDCNAKMLAMLESVPETNRTDARFQQAVSLADHLPAPLGHSPHRIVVHPKEICGWRMPL